MVPAFVQRLRILEFTLDHEAPYFSAMRRRNSRKVGGGGRGALLDLARGAAIHSTINVHCARH